MPSPVQAQFWQIERQAIWEEFNGLIMDTMLQGASNAIPLLPASLQALIDWDVLNNSSISWLRQYRSEILDAIDATTERQVRRIIEGWIRDGDPLSVLENQLAPIFGSIRAAAIAATEVTRAFAQGNIMLWDSTGVVSGKRWMTAQDELVCFPAHTQVLTQSGEKGIHKIREGDKVLTRKGWKLVKATTKRKYTGSMTTLNVNGRQLTATSTHPVWHSKQGWLPIRDFGIGDTVDMVGNQIGNVARAFDFNIGNPYNVPSVPIQVSSLSCIPVGVSMPVSTVNLKGNSIFTNGKINRISPNPGFLYVSNSQIVERKPDSLFQHGFALESTIAGKGTELTAVRGRVSKFFPAIATNNKLWRSTALLRTIFGNPSSLAGLKLASASMTGEHSNGRVATLDTANGVSVGNGFWNIKGLSANWTQFGNHYSRSVGIVAETRTKPPITTGREIVKLNPAILAVHNLSKSLSLWFGKLNLFIGRRHGKQLLTNINILYHRLSSKPIYVYDLSVDDAHEFYANGVLVHNCPFCGPLAGQVADLRGDFTLSPNAIAQSDAMKQLLGSRYNPQAALQRAMALISNQGTVYFAPPAHPRCRCYLQPFVSEVMLRDQVGDILAGQFFAEVKAGKWQGVAIG